MTDPLNVLRLPPTPAQPDPVFAESLRRRLRRALTLEEAVTTTEAVAAAWPPTLTPYIAVSDARAAIGWYTDVFRATRRGDAYEMPDGSIGHAELGIGDAVLMLSDASQMPAEAGGPPPDEPPTTHRHTLHVQVDDVDGTLRRAERAGARVERRPSDQPYGRVAVFVDPYGHRWLLNQPPPHASRTRPGDVEYVTIQVPDDERAKEFYGAVLGWEFAPGSVPRGWQVDRDRPQVGLAGGAGAAEVQLCFRVTDLDLALRRVREHGGEAGEPDRKPYGLLSECVDNQGLRFQLWQPPA